MIAAPLRFKHLFWALTGGVAIYVLWGAAVVVERVPFPYDLLVWSESPFLTNMLKLHQGVALYGPPGDANSFVYSPGLEYLCYALLSPFDLHLDLSACRAVNVGVALVATAASTWFMLRAWRELSAEPSHRLIKAVFFGCAALLVLFKNFTFDICHPDNLHALHLAGSLVLAHYAMRRESFRWALLTAALAGLGIFLKQTCALGGIGIAIYLALTCRSRWGNRRAALVVAAALSTTLLGAWWLLVAQPHGRFWLLDVLLAHPKHMSKLDHLFGYEAGFLHRAVLYPAAVLLAVRGLVSHDKTMRTTTGLWLTAGVFGVAPGLAAYTKALGLLNNLVVIDLWAALLVLPTLVSLAETHLEKDTDQKLGIVAAASLVLVSCGLYPTKSAPLDDHHRLGRAVEEALTADLARGRKVAVAHGTAMWIRAGLRSVPRDRSNSVLELEVAGRSGESDTAKRIAAGAYDRIYISWPRYSPTIERALHENYRLDATIPGVKLDDPNPAHGWTKEMGAPFLIYVPKP